MELTSSPGKGMGKKEPCGEAAVSSLLHPVNLHNTDFLNAGQAKHFLFYSNGNL